MEYQEKLLRIECVAEWNSQDVTLFHNLSDALIGYAEDLNQKVSSVYDQHKVIEAIQEEFLDDGSEFETAEEEALEYFHFNVLGVGTDNPALFIIETPDYSVHELLHDSIVEYVNGSCISEFDPYLAGVSERFGEVIGLVYDYSGLMSWVKSHYSIKDDTLARNTLLKHISSNYNIDYPFYLFHKFRD